MGVLPDYGAYHATLIADPALQGKWKLGEEAAYILVFNGDLIDRENPEEYACQILPSRLSEALPISVLREWAEALWEAGSAQELIGELTTSGDSMAGFAVHLTGTLWPKVISRLLKE